ncbi:MAG: inorganic diphosphatase [Candidatus Wildermuthbacteria bacterium]|nr:inorganic diphosphatase [Candidatus Wildermuthbacteria bacterium]
MSIKVFVEIPKGSRNKYEKDEETGEVVLDRVLYGSEAFPFDYGSISGTLGQDGDPLDVALLVTHPTFSGCAVKAEPIGYLQLEDEAGIDHKVIAVPAAKVDHRWASVKDVSDLPDHVKNEIKNFFETYKLLEPGKWVKAGEFKSKAEAEQIIQEAIERKAM